jgi:competence protein ComEA
MNFKHLLAAVAAAVSFSAFAATDVNKASAADLEAVKGIGPSIAGKIVEERKKGNFKDWNDLVSRVSGVGEGNAAKLSAAGVTVGGAAYAGAPAKNDAKPMAKKEDKPAAKKEDKPMAAAAPAAAATPAMAAKPAAAAPAVPAAPSAMAKPAAMADKKSDKPAAAAAASAPKK